MIYTVTFNPSLDYIVHMDNLNLGFVNRTKSEEIYPGGKGINVSIVLKNLGYDSKVFGFIAGFTGNEIKRLLEVQGCKNEFIDVEEGISRINIKIKAENESEINGQGPNIRKEHISKLFYKLNKLKDGDILVLAGSIPNNLPSSIYEDICERLEKKKVKIVVDATGDLLVNVLKYKPFLVKPNNHELEEIFGEKYESEEKLIEAGRRLQDMGALNVIISRGEKGAIFISQDEKIYTLKAPKGELINSVGAGDSMVAGFIAGYLQSNDFEVAFKMAVVTGSATAFSPWLTTEEKVRKLLKEWCNENN